MRTYEEYKQILELWERGTNKKTISEITGIPRITVSDCIKRYGNLAGLENSGDQLAELTLVSRLQGETIPETAHVHEAYAYLLGLYLGDGYINRVRNVYLLRVSLDARYPNIINRCAQAIKTLLPNNEVSLVDVLFREKLSCINVSCFYKYWPEVFPQHGEGMKHTRPIRLESWQRQIVTAYPLEFFRGLYHSDGSRFSNIVYGRDYPRYQFSNKSQDILKLFCDICDLLGLHWTEKTHKADATDVYISKRKDVEYLDSVIGPKS